MSTRFGIKGSDAPALLQHLGLPHPAATESGDALAGA